MAEQNRAVIVDGVTYNLSDQGAQLVEKLTRDLADASGKITSQAGQIAALSSDHQKVVGAKDAEAATLRAALDTANGEIAGLTAKLADTASIDALIAQREATIMGARRILGDSFDPKGKSDADIRREAVVKRLGDAQVAGKSDDYVAAAFDTLTVTAPKLDPVRGVLRDGIRTTVPTTDAAAAHAEMLARMRSGWQNQTEKGAH